MPSTSHTPLIGYLLGTFPQTSQTFILREILALEQQGVALHLFSLHRPKEKTVHALVSQVRAHVTYIPRSMKKHGFRLLAAHLTLCAHNPRRYVSALRVMIQRQEPKRFTDWCQAGYLAWALQQTGVQHLHAHFIRRAAGIAELVYALLGLPYSISAHAKDIYLSLPDALDRKMRQAKFVITCTEASRQFLQKHSTSTTPIYRIYHGIDPQYFTPRVPGESMTRDKVPMILSVGRFVEKKGFPYLLKACRILRDNSFDFRCIIVGYGPLHDTLKRQIAHQELKDIVELPGMLTQEKLLALYQQATMFVLPCQITGSGDRDGIPNVLLEAMAMALPTISTALPSIAELIQHQQNGLLVPAQDAGSLAAAMQDVLEQPSLRQVLGHAGRQTVCRRFSSDRNAEQIKTLLLTGAVHPPRQGGTTL